MFGWTYERYKTQLLFIGIQKARNGRKRCGKKTSVFASRPFGLLDVLPDQLGNDHPRVSAHWVA